MTLSSLTSGLIFHNKCEHHHRQKQTDWTGAWCTHIAAVESQLEEVRRTVSNHVLERVVVQAEVLKVGQEIHIYHSDSGIKVKLIQLTLSC